MVAIYCRDDYRLGVECRVRLIVYSSDAFAPLRGKAHGLFTVALMKGDMSVAVCKADNFVAGDRHAYRAALVGRAGEVVEIVADCITGLVCHNIVEPVGLWANFGVGKDFNYVAAA